MLLHLTFIHSFHSLIIHSSLTSGCHCCDIHCCSITFIRYYSLLFDTIILVIFIHLFIDTFIYLRFLFIHSFHSHLVASYLVFVIHSFPFTLLLPFTFVTFVDLYSFRYLIVTFIHSISDTFAIPHSSFPTVHCYSYIVNSFDTFVHLHSTFRYLFHLPFTFSLYIYIVPLYSFRWFDGYIGISIHYIFGRSFLHYSFIPHTFLLRLLYVHSLPTPFSFHSFICCCSFIHSFSYSFDTFTFITFHSFIWWCCWFVTFPTWFVTHLMFICSFCLFIYSIRPIYILLLIPSFILWYSFDPRCFGIHSFDWFIVVGIYSFILIVRCWPIICWSCWYIYIGFILCYTFCSFSCWFDSFWIDTFHLICYIHLFWCLCCLPFVVCCLHTYIYFLPICSFWHSFLVVVSFVLLFSFTIHLITPFFIPLCILHCPLFTDHLLWLYTFTFYCYSFTIHICCWFCILVSHILDLGILHTYILLHSIFIHYISCYSLLTFVNSFVHCYICSLPHWHSHAFIVCCYIDGCDTIHIHSDVRSFDVMYSVFDPLIWHSFVCHWFLRCSFPVIHSFLFIHIHSYLPFVVSCSYIYIRCFIHCYYIYSTFISFDHLFIDFIPLRVHLFILFAFFHLFHISMLFTFLHFITYSTLHFLLMISTFICSPTFSTFPTLLFWHTSSISRTHILTHFHSTFHLHFVAIHSGISLWWLLHIHFDIHSDALLYSFCCSFYHLLTSFISFSLFVDYYIHFVIWFIRLLLFIVMIFILFVTFVSDSFIVVVPIYSCCPHLLSSICSPFDSFHFDTFHSLMHLIPCYEFHSTPHSLPVHDLMYFHSPFHSYLGTLYSFIHCYVLHWYSILLYSHFIHSFIVIHSSYIFPFHFVIHLLLFVLVISFVFLILHCDHSFYILFIHIHLLLLHSVVVVDIHFIHYIVVIHCTFIDMISVFIVVVILIHSLLWCWYLLLSFWWLFTFLLIHYSIDCWLVTFIVYSLMSWFVVTLSFVIHCWLIPFDSIRWYVIYCYSSFTIVCYILPHSMTIDIPGGYLIIRSFSWCCDTLEVVHWWYDTWWLTFVHFDIVDRYSFIVVIWWLIYSFLIIPLIPVVFYLIHCYHTLLHSHLLLPTYHCCVDCHCYSFWYIICWLFIIHSCLHSVHSLPIHSCCCLSFCSFVIHSTFWPRYIHLMHSSCSHSCWATFTITFFTFYHVHFIYLFIYLFHYFILFDDYSVLLPFCCCYIPHSLLIHSLLFDSRLHFTWCWFSFIHLRFHLFIWFRLHLLLLFSHFIHSFLFDCYICIHLHLFIHLFTHIPSFISDTPFISFCYIRYVTLFFILPTFLHFDTRCIHIWSFTVIDTLHLYILLFHSFDICIHSIIWYSVLLLLRCCYCYIHYIDHFVVMIVFILFISLFFQYLLLSFILWLSFTSLLHFHIHILMFPSFSHFTFHSSVDSFHSPFDSRLRSISCALRSIPTPLFQICSLHAFFLIPYIPISFTRFWFDDSYDLRMITFYYYLRYICYILICCYSLILPITIITIPWPSVLLHTIDDGCTTNDIDHHSFIDTLTKFICPIHSFIVHSIHSLFIHSLILLFDVVIRYDHDICSDIYSFCCVVHTFFVHLLTIRYISFIHLQYLVAFDTFGILFVVIYSHLIFIVVYCHLFDDDYGDIHFTFTIFYICSYYFIDGISFTLPTFLITFYIHCCCCYSFIHLLCYFILLVTFILHSFIYLCWYIHSFWPHSYLLRYTFYIHFDDTFVVVPLTFVVNSFICTFHSILFWFICWSVTFIPYHLEVIVLSRYHLLLFPIRWSFHLSFPSHVTFTTLHLHFRYIHWKFHSHITFSFICCCSFPRYIGSLHSRTFWYHLFIRYIIHVVRHSSTLLLLFLDCYLLFDHLTVIHSDTFIVTFIDDAFDSFILTFWILMPDVHLPFVISWCHDLIHSFDWPSVIVVVVVIHSVHWYDIDCWFQCILLILHSSVFDAIICYIYSHSFIDDHLFWFHFIYISIHSIYILVLDT